MTTKETLQEMVDFFDELEPSDDPFDLIVAREIDTGDDGESSEYEFKRTKLLGNLPEQMAEFAKGKISNKAEALDNGSKEATDYSARNISDHSDYVQRVDADSIPRFEQYTELLTTDDFRTTDYITDEGEPPQFQVILARGGGERVLVFQDVTRREILGKNDKIRFYSNDDNYKKIDNTIIEIPNRIDAIYYDGNIYIFDQRRFEKIFDYMDEFADAAADTIESIVDSDVPIHSDDIFLDAVTSYPNATRLFYVVRDRALWENDDVDMGTFGFIIDEFDLSIEVEEQGGEKGIVMDDKRNVWEVIHLCNDDHLSSPITEAGYQVDGKEERTDEVADS